MRATAPKPGPARRGFTLIELMIVVAIIAMMATFALPSYQERVIQSQVREGLQLAGFAQEAVAEVWARQRQWPRDNAAAGLPPADRIVGRMVAGVEVRGGSIVILFGQQANRFLAGRRLALRPATVPEHPKVPIAWVCGLAAVPERMQAPADNATDLPPPFLPLDCRPK